MLFLLDYLFNFSTTSFTSIPCTAHASSNVSICEAGHPKQCIPTSSNNSAFSGAFSNISPIVVSYILLFYFINFGIFLLLSYFFKKV